MYLACRHIKPNGVRCESPALRGNVFCYFHSKLHSATRIGESDEFRLPVPENPAAIHLSIAQIFAALLASRIDAKMASQLLWGLQIASQTIPRGEHQDPESILSLSLSKEGQELAPEARICNGLDNCNACKYHDGCTNMQRRLFDDDDDDDDDDDE